MVRVTALARLQVLLIMLGALAVPVAAQQGRIVGTIFDNSGAVMPGVMVTAINNATQVKLSFLTDATGNYDFPGLIVGSYTIRATQAGFKTGEARVIAEVAQVVRQNLNLMIGEIREVVTVFGERIPLLLTESAELGQVVTNREILELPLNGRNFLQLVTLGTGVTQWGNESLVSMAGSRPGMEQYLIDGASINRLGNSRPVLAPSVDSIQEFKLQSGTFAAEYGRGAGIVNVATKSGGNQFRGSLYEFWRNDLLDANGFFVNQQKNPQKAKLNRHQFGGTLGGRIRRDKTFFFTAYESERRRNGLTTTFRAPTALERAGDFSRSPGVQYLLDPFTYQLFPGKVVPANRISPVYKYFESWFPGPNDVTGLLYSGSPVSAYTSDQFSGRLDHVFSSKDRIWGRYFYVTDNSHNPGWGTKPDFIGSINQNVHNRAQQFVAHWDHIFSARLLLDFQYSHVRWSSLTKDPQTGFPEDKVTNHVVASGIGGMEFASKLFPGAPAFIFGNNFPNYPSDLSPATQLVLNNSWKADLTWVKGRHTIKTGLDFLFQNHQAVTAFRARGYLTFGGITTGFQNAWSDFVMGIPYYALRGIPPTRIGESRNTYHYFVQDEFKVTPRLTINLGARYEGNLPATPLYSGAVVDTNTGKIIFSDVDGSGRPNSKYAPGLAIMLPLVGNNLVSSSSLGLSPNFVNNDRTGLAPRVSVAWRPWGDKTVVRAGYGIYYILDTAAYNWTLNALMPPFAITQYGPLNLAYAQVGRPMVPIEQYFQPFEQTTNIAPDQWAAFSINPQYRNPYENQFSVSIQRMITSNLVFETVYEGKTVVHMQGTRQVALPANRPAFVPPYTSYLSQDANSNYHSLQLRLEKRLSYGLAFLGSYTWSKAIDSGSSSYFGTDSVVGDLQTRRRGVALFDIPQRLAVSMVYDLPFGAGRKWLSGKPALLGDILGGWQLSVIDQFQSGRPFDVAWLGGGTSDPRNPIASIPDRIGSGKLANPTPENWFDASAFVAHRKPPDPNNPGMFLPQEGNSGRNVLRSDGVANWDIGIMKNFRFGKPERFRLQFRAEMFNAFNRVTFDAPSTAGGSIGGGTVTVGGAGATTVINQWNTPRQIQFALKLYF